MSRPFLVIVGPTASGKSEIALALAQRLGGEILSADSMQVYRGMDIGTAKPGRRERALIPHHLIDILDPTEDYSAYHFYEHARAALDGIAERGKVPILVGGTGFYVRSLLRGILPNLGNTEVIRARYEAEVRSSGLAALYHKLERLDPQRASKIHPRDQKRIIRAFEIYEVSGVLPSRIPEQLTPIESLGYIPVVCGITWDRASLYAQIDKRVEAMFDQGWVEEARGLSARPLSKTARQALGYRELYQHFDSPITSLDAVKRSIQQHTRHYARRQWIWFKKEPGIRWFERGPELSEALIESLQDHFEDPKKA